MRSASQAVCITARFVFHFAELHEQMNGGLIERYREWYRRQSAAVKGAVITVAGTALIVLASGVVSLVQDILTRTDSDLRLVEARIIQSDGAPLLEVQLRNAGEVAAVVKQAKFTVKQVTPLPRDGMPRAVIPISGRYEVVLPTHGTQQTVSVPLSHGLAPDTLDRFVFVLLSDASAGQRHALTVDFELLYDEDDKELRERDLRFETIGRASDE
jgi:hypothetical protein